MILGQPLSNENSFINKIKKMKLKKLLTSLILASVVLFAGCEKDDFIETVGVCPVVISTTPENGSINIPLDQVITATFNEEMNASSFTSASFILQGTSLVDGTVSFSGVTASFTPNTPLALNTTYTAIIKTSVVDLMGNALQKDYEWSFSTGATVSPLVINTDPEAGDIGVYLNKIVAATFNMPMNNSTINASTFILKQGTTEVNGAVTYNGNNAYFVPASSLNSNTEYTATITSGAKNLQGTALSSNFVWKFTTGTITAPRVISTDPTNNATNVAFDKIITATFDIAMDQATITNLTFTLKDGNTSILGAVSYLGSTATFIPNVDLLTNTTYTATITTGAKNLAGIPLANNYVWNFSTITTSNGTGVNLGSAENFGILAGVGVSNNAGFSEIHDMNVGISPGVRSSITGFPPAIIVNGAMFASDDIAPTGVPAMLTQAKQDLTNAYLFIAGMPSTATVSGDQGGLTLAPGVYKSTSTLLIQSGDLTLDAQGDANAIFVFQVASAFTTVGGAGGNIILTNGAQAKNVYWQTGSSATIGDYTAFKGNILALQSITMGAYSTAVGRMLARNGSVVMTHTNIIDRP